MRPCDRRHTLLIVRMRPDILPASQTGIVGLIRNRTETDRCTDRAENGHRRFPGSRRSGRRSGKSIGHAANEIPEPTLPHGRILGGRRRDSRRYRMNRSAASGGRSVLRGSQRKEIVTDCADHRREQIEYWPNRPNRNVSLRHSGVPVPRGRKPEPAAPTCCSPAEERIESVFLCFRRQSWSTILDCDGNVRTPRPPCTTRAPIRGSMLPQWRLSRLLQGSGGVAVGPRAATIRRCIGDLELYFSLSGDSVEVIANQPH